MLYKSCGKPKKTLILICAALVAVLGIGGFFLFGGSRGPEIGEIIQFGGYDWRVLDVDRRGRALIITENVVGQRSYHDSWEAVTWETSDIRRYLNEEFYNSFSASDRARIRQTTVVNNDNPWSDAPGGNDTTDKIFLLSLEELVRYFGDSGMLAGGVDPNARYDNLNSISEDRGIHWWGFQDQYSEARIAHGADGAYAWWWLRSPGYFEFTNAACIHFRGGVVVFGLEMDIGDGGVRPALWLRP